MSRNRSFANDARGPAQVPKVRTLGIAVALFATSSLINVRPVQAQVVRGVVLDEARRGISGVVVALLDSTDAVVARSLSTESGEYRVAAPRGGTYRMRTLRIGFQSFTSQPLVLAVGAVQSVELALSSVRVTLQAIRVVEQNSCARQSPAMGQALFSVWEQAMTSITATSLTASRGGFTSTTLQIDRTLDASGRRVKSQQATQRTEVVRQPWASLSADSLRRGGYTYTDKDNSTTYYAPDLDVLVSPYFLSDHCIRLTTSRDSAEIGVVFEPVAARRRLSEIRGTLWLDRQTAELRRLEFVFTGGPTATSSWPAGGSMLFTRLPNGAVVISAWEIRMPSLVKDSPRDTRVRVAEMIATGGQLVVLRRGTDTVFRHPPIAVRGIVQDSVAGHVIPRATVALSGTSARAITGEDGRFVLEDVLPGEYTLAVRTASLDSVQASMQTPVMVTERMEPVRLRVPTAAQLAASLCGTSLAGASGRGKGAVLGTVRYEGDAAIAVGVRVIADWSEFVARPGSSAGVDRVSKRLETRSDASGAYRLCGVPSEALLTVRAQPARGRSVPVTVRLSPDERFATRELRVDPSASAVATFVGVVVADSSARLLADVDIAIPALSLRTRSNERGEFRLTDIPAGTHELQVRRVGYAAITTSLTFAANDEEDRRLILRPLTVLDSVEVSATRIDPRLLEFEENRRVGLGHFLTSEDLDKNIGRRLGDVMSMMPGSGVVRGRSGAWVMSKRYVVPIRALGRPTGEGSAPPDNSPVWTPSPVDRNLGLVAGCYAHVYVDGKLMNPGTPAEPFDINIFAPDQLKGIEWYAGPAQTPAQYATLNSPCGVLVLHTRR